MSAYLQNPAYEINGKAATAADFYAVACNPERSVCVEACAGAGKTWMLIERMVKALQNGADADQILAITFTKKAAGEMRSRLQERLASPELASLRAKVLGSGRRVQILTFHAWFAQLMAAAPIGFLQHMNLPLASELLEDYSVLLPDLRHAFYAAALTDSGLRADFSALIEELGRAKVDDALVDLLAKRTEFELADEAGQIEQSVQDSEPHSLDNERLSHLAKRLGTYKGKKQIQAASELEAALANEDFLSIQEALLTSENKPRVLTSKDMSEEDAALLSHAQEDVLAMLVAKHQHDCWLHQERMTRVGRVWLRTFAKLKFDKGLVDMADLERAATELLSHSDIASSVQERLDQKLRHVLIDEFQDTNPMQWQAVHAWLASYAGAGGGQERPSLFIVGDPKQSIYRFRRAEPRVFMAAQAFMHEVFDAALLSCDHTRRSSRAVLGVVNRAMQDALQADEYKGFRVHTTASEEQGAAICLPMIERQKKPIEEASDHAWRDSLSEPRFDAEESLKMREAEQAAAWIAEQIARASNAPSVMVLARTHASLALMQEALQRIGIASSLQERQLLADVPAVQDVLALLECLVSPRHDLALARALKSPLFGYLDADLVQLRVQQLAAQPGQKSWFDLLNGDIKTQLLRWQTWLNRLPPHDALQAIYDDGNVLNKYLAAMPSTIRLASHSALKALLTSALQQGGGRYLTAYAFVRAMRSSSQTIKAPSVPAVDAVQLLTIHGAKGLEADVVLLLDSDPEPRKSKTMTTLVDWQPDEAAPRKFVFLQSEAAPPACARALLDADLQARELEEINTLYVAMTRARQTLAVSATQAHRSNPRSTWHRLRTLGTTAEAREALPAKPHPDWPAGHMPNAKIRSYLPKLTLTLPDFDAPKRAIEAPSESAKLGLALHKLLQWQSTSEAALMAVANEFGLTNEQVQSCKRQAEIMQNGEAAWIWDADKIDWQANEYEVFDKGRADWRLLRIDRLVKERATQMWWVIDFKSALEPQRQTALREQLSTYVIAVSDAMGVSKNRIQAAFVSGDGHLILCEPFST